MNKEILKLAIPNIISNISVPLLSTVDTALMGRFSEMHIGAVGVGAMIFNFIYWNFGFLRMGTTGLTAQAFGKQDKSLITHTLGRALLITIAIAIFVLLLQKPLALASFPLMNVLPEQSAILNDYYYIRIWAAPATLGLYAMLGWFFGMQNAIYPLIITIFINIINIIFNFLFVFQFGMEADGVAYATVIAQYSGLILAFVLFYLKYKNYLQHLRLKIVLEIGALRRFLRINSDIFIRTVCLTFAFGFFYSQSAGEGATILAVNVILLQFLNWMSYGVDGFAFASESLVGKYIGANDSTKVKRAIRLSFIWGMGLAILFSLFYGLLGVNLLYIFTDQTYILEAAIPYLWWMVLLPIVGTPCYIWDGIYIGLTAVKEMRNSMLLALILYLAVHYTIKPHYGNDGLWFALLLFLGARGLIQWILFERQIRMRHG